MHVNTLAQKFIGEDGVRSVQTSAGMFPAELVILSVGVRPNTAFLNDTGLEMVKGTLVVNSRMQTNLPHIYAAGDCCMVTNRIEIGRSAVVAHGIFRQPGRPHAGTGIRRQG